MSKVEIKLDYQGVGELMKSQEVMDELNAQADSIIARCGGSYEKNERTGKTRCNVSISTKDRKTYFKNLKDNELLKALR